MEDSDLRKMWQTLAGHNIIDEKMAEEQILAIISQKGKGLISKLQKKHWLDFKVYLILAVLVPVVVLFVLYWKNHGRTPEGLLDIQGQYLVPFLLEAFLIYVLVRIRMNISFLGTSHNTESVRQSLVSVRSYFRKLYREGFWTGTISLITILAVYQLTLLKSIGGLQYLNFSFEGSYIFESWIFVFLLIVMLGIPFMVKSDGNKYRDLLKDVDQAIAELSNENE